MLHCPTCRCRRHAITKIKVQKGKKYWVSSCTSCLKDLKVEEYEDRGKKD